MVIVEGFYINIVSEACLLKSRVWYSSADCLLQYRLEEKSITLLKLTHKFNLVFIELKLLSSYLGVLSSI